MFERIKKLRGERGFTLVELLVTVTIIGVLAAVVTVGVSGASNTSQTKANQAQFNGVQSALDDYAATNPSATGVPVTGTVFDGTQTGYYTADGSSAYTTLASDKEINFASTTNSFNTFFRLNASSGTVSCIVGSTTSFTLKACKN
jgi:prepilin-type N-terminal cleavage/methylation domain-containing protein